MKERIQTIRGRVAYALLLAMTQMPELVLQLSIVADADSTCECAVCLAKKAMGYAEGEPLQVGDLDVLLREAAIAQSRQMNGPPPPLAGALLKCLEEGDEGDMASLLTEEARRVPGLSAAVVWLLTGKDTGRATPALPMASAPKGANTFQVKNTYEERIEMAKNEEQKSRAKDVEIIRGGEQIILPEEMSLDEGIEWLMKKKAADERVVGVSETIQGYVLDGAQAFMEALKEIYGFVDTVATPGFWGPTPPQFIQIESGVNETVQVAWGRILIPGIEGYLNTDCAMKDKRWVFQIGGEVKRKDLYKVDKIAKVTREKLKAQSIYRGKAVRIHFPEEGERFGPMDYQPKFIDTKSVNAEELILSKNVEDDINTSLFTPIVHTQACRDAKIPLKRGVLLYGVYGTGKTLTAYVTAQLAESKGWTFLYLKSVKQLDQAILFAKQYQPCVIFAEDIDQAMEDGERDEEMNQVLNTIDGVDTKGSEVIVVLSTNFVDKINPAMLRPGRLDAAIEVCTPDAEAIARLMKVYGRGLIEDDADLSEPAQLLQGTIPAFVREAIERAKLASISNSKGGAAKISAHDLTIAARGLKNHLALVDRKPIRDLSDIERAAQLLGGTLVQAAEANKKFGNGHAELEPASPPAKKPAIKSHAQG